MADFEKFRADGTEKIKLKDLETDCRDKSRSRSEYEAETAKKQKEIQEIQDRFYADGREGLILVLQAMDAAGKDGTVKHVMSGVNPQGVDVSVSSSLPRRILHTIFCGESGNAFRRGARLAFLIDPIMKMCLW